MLLFERSTKRVLGLKQQRQDTNKKPAETFDLSAGITVFKQRLRNSAFASTQFFKQSPCSLHLGLLANLMALIFLKYHKHARVNVLHLRLVLGLFLWALTYKSSNQAFCVRPWTHCFYTCSPLMQLFLSLLCGYIFKGLIFQIFVL